MNDQINDILDLCRLNQMEEHIQESPVIDRDITLRAIDVAKRDIVTRMQPSPIADGVIDRHRAENTAADGVYPFTGSPNWAEPT